MSNPNNQSSPRIRRSEQYVQNASFDEEFQVLAVENLVYNSSTGTLDRMTQPGASSSSGKATDAYAISNEEDTGTYEYYGFEDASGNWYILRVTSASGIYQYAAGSSNYSTAWTNRASQTYASYSTTF